MCACRLRDRPDLRATGRVVAILEETPRRQRVVGVLQQEARYVSLIPVDLKMPKCHVRTSELPNTIKKLLEVRLGGGGCPLAGGWGGGYKYPVLV